MNELTPIFLLLFAAAAGYAAYLWKKLSTAEQLVRVEQKALEDKREEAERARKEARERREELEATRKQLQDAKNKLKQKEPKAIAPSGPAKGQGSSPKKPEPEAHPTVGAIVRVSNEEFEEQNRRAMEKLEQQLHAAEGELSRMKKLEADRAREAERAARALDAAAAAGTPEAPKVEVVKAEPVVERTAAEEVEALKTQIEALRRAAYEREKDLKRSIDRAEREADHALRRASNNLQLYLVLKGQLELTEDRLATLKRKYEGAKSPEELRRESNKRKDRPRRDRGEAKGAEGSDAAEASAPEGEVAAEGGAAAAEGGAVASEGGSTVGAVASEGGSTVGAVTAEGGSTVGAAPETAVS